MLRSRVLLLMLSLCLIEVLIHTEELAEIQDSIDHVQQLSNNVITAGGMVVLENGEMLLFANPDGELSVWQSAQGGQKFESVFLPEFGIDNSNEFTHVTQIEVYPGVNKQVVVFFTAVHDAKSVVYALAVDPDGSVVGITAVITSYTEYPLRYDVLPFDFGHYFIIERTTENRRWSIFHPHAPNALIAGQLSGISGPINDVILLYKPGRYTTESIHAVILSDSVWSIITDASGSMTQSMVEGGFEADYIHISGEPEQNRQFLWIEAGNTVQQYVFTDSDTRIWEPSGISFFLSDSQRLHGVYHWRDRTYVMLEHTTESDAYPSLGIAGENNEISTIQLPELQDYDFLVNHAMLLGVQEDELFAWVPDTGGNQWQPMSDRYQFHTMWERRMLAKKYSLLGIFGQVEYWIDSNHLYTRNSYEN